MRLKFAGWTDRNTRLFLGVTLVKGFGNTAMSLGASIWVLSLTGSASLAALCGLCVYAPSLAGPVIGTVADRLPRQRMLIGTCLTMAAVLLSLTTVGDRNDIWLIYAVMLCYGFAYVLLGASESGILQAVIPAERRGTLNSLRTTVLEGMKLVAPLVGAGLFVWAGGGSIAVLSAACLTVAAWLYSGIRFGQNPVVAGIAEGGIVGQTREGLRFLLRHRELRATVVVAAIAVATSGLCDAASLLVIVDDLGYPPAFAGVTATAQGAGSIIGGLLGAAVLARFGEGGAVRLGAALFAAGLATLCIPWLPSVLGARLLIGISLPWTVIAAITAVQRLTAADLIGRVTASANTLIFGSVAFTISIGAGLVVILDHGAVLTLAALIALTAAISLRSSA